MASAHVDAGENEAEVPPAPAASAHELLRIAVAPGNAAVTAALPAASDAAGATVATAAGAGEDDADARAAALPYVRDVTVVPTGEDEADAPPV